MLNNPLLTRAISCILLGLGLYLALENTLISANVLQFSSGATIVTAFGVAVLATGLELVFASWIRQERTLIELSARLRKNPVGSVVRMFGSGLGLFVVYHFDLLTTARHPAFTESESYFFGVIVLALVFGPEVCIVIALWLWQTARDIESRQLDKNTTKDAENRRLKTKRDRLLEIAEEAGKAEAISTARERWGGGDNNGRP